MLGIISTCPEPGTLCPFTPSLHPPWSASVQPQEQQDGQGPSAVAGELALGQPLRAGIGTLQEPRMQTAPSVSHRAAYSQAVRPCVSAGLRLTGRALELRACPRENLEKSGKKPEREALAS